MIVRLEETKDYREVENLTREAFWNVYRPGCTEHYVLNQYRTNPDFIPELDLVMIENDMIIGNVIFSKAELMLEDGSKKASWTFGPISIHPDYKRKGYGLSIILRPWCDNDAETLYKWASNPDVGPRAGWAPHQSVEESLEIIRTVFNDALYTWAIELKENGEASN